MKTPTASLVVPVYGGWEYVRCLLQGLEPLPPWLQIIVVDDMGPTTDFASFDSSFGCHVQLIRRAVNGGFAAAVNTGVSAARGDVIVVANSDILIGANDLERMVTHVCEQPDRIIGPRTYRANGKDICVAHKFPTPLRESAELFIPYRLLRHLRNEKRSDYSKSVDCDWVLGSCLAFTPSSWHRIGPIDESYRMYSEEIDWQRRASAVGLRSRLQADVKITHDESHGLTRGSAAAERRFREIWRSRMMYQRRWNAKRFGPARLRIAWMLAALVNAPLWAAIAIAPSVRSEAFAELRNLWFLVRSIFCLNSGFTRTPAGAEPRSCG